jgi:hypothetical protein
MLPLLDSAGRKISQLEEVISSHLEEEGRALALAVADMCSCASRAATPASSLEPAVQGPVKGFPEAARDGIEDVACVVAEWFEREPKDT